MNRLPDQDELLLTAFQYVAGELTAAESARFESRLADDLAAQEALADAVLLADSLQRPIRVAAARPTQLAAARPTVPVAQGRNRAFVAAVMAACAIGLVALAWPGPTDDRVAVDGPAPFRVSDQERARSLLDVWSEMAAGATAEPDGSVDDSTGGDLPESEGDELPEWLLHAVAEAEGGVVEEPSRAPAEPVIDDDEET